MPFGGASGTSSESGRLGGRHALEAMTEVRSVSIPFPTYGHPETKRAWRFQHRRSRGRRGGISCLRSGLTGAILYPRHRLVSAIYAQLIQGSTDDHAPLIAAYDSETLMRRSGIGPSLETAASKAEQVQSN
jgi:hypothetical protein